MSSRTERGSETVPYTASDTASSSPSPRVSISLALLAATLALSAGCDRESGSPADATGPGKQAEHDDHDDHGAQDDHDHGAHDPVVHLAADAVLRHGVTVAEASLWILRPTFVAPARVGFDAESMAHVGAPLSGRVVEIRARVGERVERGAPLLAIESSELAEAQAEFHAARAAAEGAAPAVRLARSAWERSQELLAASQGISRSEVDRREAELRAAEAAERTAAASLSGAAHRLRVLGMTEEAVAALAENGAIDPRATVAAPIAGEIVLREATIGEMVGPEREALLVIADTARYWVLADISEGRLAEVARGSKVWVRAGADGRAVLEGTIATISPFVDAATRTAQARIVVPADALPLKPGMFVQVEVVSGDPAAPEPPAVVAVPEGAIQTVDGAPVLFVPIEGEEHAFRPRAVTVGRTVGGLVPILDGLVEGERFVGAGSFILKAELGKASAEHSH